MRKGFVAAIKGVSMMLPVLLCALFIYAGEKEASAGVNVDMNINLGPPPITIPAPPAVVLVPRSKVYYVPQTEVDVFFHDGYWWSPRGKHWYRSKEYNGPWRTVEHRHVPKQVRGVPHDFRHRYEKEKHIPYGQWKKHHRKHNKRDSDDRGRRDEHREHNDQREHGGRGEGGERGRGHGR